jgi:hypothetical protein
LPLNVTSWGLSSPILPTKALISSFSVLSPTCGDQGADANDRMVDVLRKPVSYSFADFFVGLPGQPVRGREAAEVGHGLKVPDDDATAHGLRASTKGH